MKNGYFKWILCVCLYAGTVNADWLDKAINAYNTGSYQDAINILQPKADNGNAEANYYLGQIYRMGRGVEPDNQKAKSYYLAAANQDHVDAQRNLGSLFFFETEVDTENPDALKWLTKAADKGDAWSQWFLGKMYFNGQGVDKDINEAYKWFDAAGKQDHEQAREAAAEIKVMLSDQSYEAENSETDEMLSMAEPKTTSIDEVSTTVASQEGSKAYVIQLAAFKTMNNAERGKQIIGDNIDDLLTDYKILIKELPGANSLPSFKLQIGPIEKASAALQFCDEIKSKGQDCFVSRIKNALN